MDQTIGKLLIEHGYEFSSNVDQYMKWAVQNGKLKVLKYLFCNRIINRFSHGSLLEKACESGQLEIVKYLYKVGVVGNYYMGGYIDVAAGYGHLEVVKYLVNKNQDPISYDNRAIAWAFANDHLEVLKYLLEIGCNHMCVKRAVKYEVLQGLTVKLKILLNKRMGFKQNKYLQIEILKMILPTFTEYEIMSIL